MSQNLTKVPNKRIRLVEHDQLEKKNLLIMTLRRQRWSITQRIRVRVESYENLSIEFLGVRAEI